MPTTHPDELVATAVSALCAVESTKTVAMPPMGVSKTLFQMWRIGRTMLDMQGAVSPGHRRFRRNAGLLSSLPAAYEQWTGHFISRSQFHRCAELARRCKSPDDLPIGVNWSAAKTAIDGGRALPQSGLRPPLYLLPPQLIIERLTHTWVRLLPAWHIITTTPPIMNDLACHLFGLRALLWSPAPPPQANPALTTHNGPRPIAVIWNEGSGADVHLGMQNMSVQACTSTMLRHLHDTPAAEPFLLYLSRGKDDAIAAQLAPVLGEEDAAAVVATAQQAWTPVILGFSHGTKRQDAPLQPAPPSLCA